MDKNTLYQQIKIQELPQIQNEVLDYFETNPNVLDGYGDDFFIHVPLDSLPVAKSFLLPRAQLEVNEVSVYFIPPNHKTKIYITTNELNFPINFLFLLLRTDVSLNLSAVL